MPKTIREWINEVLTESDTEWVIAVFKLNGGFMDGSGISRQTINELSFPRMLKSLDWTITTTRRKLGNKTMRFVPFIGGDKESGVNVHIHAFVEIPKNSNVYELNDNLKRYWKMYSEKSLQKSIKSEVWIQPYKKELDKKHTYYVTRYEGNSFMYGDEKVLIECKSFLLN
jgi:hypothetical protein